MKQLTPAWPTETAGITDDAIQWDHPLSNSVLDFHGDPDKAKVTVLSDGNHHMALQEAMAQFLKLYPDAQDVFYVTLPPRLIKIILLNHGIYIGNLHLTINADVLLSPLNVIQELTQSGHVKRNQVFAKNKGSVLLVRKGNPKNIQGLADLFRTDICLFISNPETEKVSHQGYRSTLINMSKARALDYQALADRIDTGTDNIVWGEQVHHREAPLALAQEQCDAAIVYYHLALRFTRIFPELFALVFLEGGNELINDENNNSSEVHMAMATDAGKWGNLMWEYLQTDAEARIYEHHGLVPLRK